LKIFSSSGAIKLRKKKVIGMFIKRSHDPKGMKNFGEIDED
jgi:hypothetical protein